MIRGNPIQEIKSGVDKIKFQIDGLLLLQKNSPFINPFYEETLIIEGIQMISIGIQAIHSVYNFSKYFNKYQGQYQKLFEEIKTISTPPDILQQQNMLKTMQEMIQLEMMFQQQMFP